MHGVVLVEFGVLLDLAHHDNDGGDALEDAIVRGALVILPGTDEMRHALMEELGIDLDLCHLDRWRGAEDGRPEINDQSWRCLLRGGVID